MTDARPSNLQPPSPAGKLGNTRYSYQPLDDSRNEIRVLVIQPDILSETLRCKIKHIDLDDFPEFTAISYAWGDPNDTCLMILERERFPITRSLWGALCALSVTGSEVIVWADAVCINQSDQAERNSQIRKMAQVYSHASQVALWLGPAADYSYLGLALLDSVVLGGNSNVTKAIEASNQSIGGRLNEFGALVKLFERSYWYRLWCVQEVWNAREITVYCGHHRTSWTKFQQVQSILSEHGNLMPVGKGRSVMSLFHALVTHRDKLCRDPKDKIFAILGLLQENERLKFYDAYQMDYSRTVCEIFTSVVGHHLRTKCNLDVICASIHGANPHCLPSWVPDWTMNNVRKPLVMFDPRFLAASPTTASQSYISPQGCSLFVQGVILDTVHTVHNETNDTNDFKATLITFNTWCSSLCDDFGIGPDIHYAFCRTICLNQISDAWDATNLPHFIYKAMKSLSHDFIPRFRPDRRLDAYIYPPSLFMKMPAIDVYSRYLKKALTAHRLVVTRTPLICLGAGSFEAGDIAAVLLGCSMPVVLRKTDDRKYKFIGEIYVDGYMYRRAIEELNDGSRQLQTFELV